MEKQFNEKEKPVLLILVSILIVAVSFATIQNTTRLQAVVNSTAKAYINDVSHQLVQGIDIKLKKIWKNWRFCPMALLLWKQAAFR